MRCRPRRWYASLLPSLDANGKQELNTWRGAAFGERAVH